MEQKQYTRLSETLYTETLENGLTIYVIPKPDIAKKYAFFATSYGGADRKFQLDGTERDTPAGIAHFLEHKLFDTEDGNALADLAANGASPNAFTSSELTAYHFECTEGFEENLKTLIDFVSVPYFTEESVAKEQGIIGQEINMVEDMPEYVMYFNFLKSIYAHHPVRDSVAGTVESIGEITAQTLYDLHRAFYRPSNMVLCAVGDIDPDFVVNVAREMLPVEYHAPPVKEYGEKDTQPLVKAKTEVQMAVAKPLFIAGVRVEPGLQGKAYQKQELIGHLANAYLAGKSSPFYVRLYSEGLITSDFSVGFMSGLSYAFSMFSGESADPERVLEEIKAEVAVTLEQGIDEARFTRLKRATMGDLIREFDNVEHLCYAQTTSHFHGASALDQLDILQSIESADVLAFIKENLTPERFAISIVNPM